MATSTRRPTLAALLLATAVMAQAASPRAVLPISVEAQSSDFDYKNGVLVFTRVVITQGDARVEADRATATGLNFESSRWRLEGNVRIRAEGGSLSSDLATVSFENDEISVAQVVGAPASFAQQRGNRSAEGRARQIDYDLTSGRVRLSGDAWLSDGSNQITGSTLVYSMREERVVAEAGEQGGRPVRITINPKTPPGLEPDKKTVEQAPGAGQ
jgi:lipopolysaccharide transport protein LptA